MEERIDKAIEILEYIMETDPRTFKNPECENAQLYEKINEALKWLKYGKNKF